MSDQADPTADDLTAAGRPPEAGASATPAVDAAPDVEVSAVTAADTSRTTAASSGSVTADDFFAGAGAPEPTD